MDATQTPEEWRPVVGYEGLYEVSDQGRVRSLDRLALRKDGTEHRLRGRLMKAPVHSNGYRALNLCRDSNRTLTYVHTMVLEAFVGPRTAGLVACHANGRREDNRVSNLRWDTYSENNFDIVRHGRHSNASKTHCKHGHEFTPENTYLRPEGGRKCHSCQREAEQRSHARTRPATRP